MAKRKIIWTLRAIRDKMLIYEYWINRNQSIVYPNKLEKMFNEEMAITAIYPLSGIKTELKNVRIKIVRDYKLVYRITDATIEIITVFDSRQDSKRLVLND